MSGLYYDAYWQTRDVLEDFPYKWPVISKLLPPDGNIKFLDFGCGTGYQLSHIRKIRPSFRITGADISPQALKSAGKRVPGSAFVAIRPDQSIPLRNNTYDCILASDVLEHIIETRQAFRELSRILKPGGQIIITVPHNGKIKLILAVIAAFDAYFDPYSPHIRFFNESTLRTCLRDAGLIPEKTGYFGRFRPVPNGMFMTAVKPKP